MKSVAKCIIPFFLIFITLELFGQGFEKIHHTEKSSIIGQMLELPGHNYLLFANRSYGWFFNPLDIVAYKISASGEFIDSLFIHEDGYALRNLYYAFVSGNHIIGICNQEDTIQKLSCGYMFCLDFNLNIQWKNTFYLKKDLNYISSVYKESDTSYYIGGFSLNSDMISNQRFFITHIDGTGTIKDSISQLIPSLSETPELLYIPIINKFHLLTSDQIYLISKDLQEVQLIWDRQNTSYNYFVIQPSAKLINDSTYLTIAMESEFYAPTAGISDNICFMKRSIDTTVISISSYGQPDTTEQIQGWPFDFSSTDSIFFLCQANPGEEPFPFSQDIWLAAYNVNINGTVNWFKWFGINGANCAPRFIRTSDGGYLLACMHYDWQALFPNYLSDIYVVKIDADGNINTAIPENVPALEFEIQFNSINSNLEVHSPSEINFLKIYDITGRLIKNYSLYKSSFTLPVSDIKPGIYIIQTENIKHEYFSKKILLF